MDESSADVRDGEGIGTLRETSLHATLKDWLAQPGDRQEVPIAGYLIDIKRGSELIEIQTGNFSALKPKLDGILDDYLVRVVHPVPEQRWIRRVTREGEVIARRKSPKRGRVEDLFSELVYIPHYLNHPNLTLELLLIHEEITWRDDGQGSWRRKGWSIYDRRLLAVVRSVIFTASSDYLRLFPDELPAEFTNRDLATSLGIKIRLAQKMTYCGVKMGLLEQSGKIGQAYLYRLTRL